MIGRIRIGRFEMTKALVLACLHFVQPPADAPRTSVPVAPVTVSLIHECVISARDTGVIHGIEVTEGQRVEQGALVAALDSEDQELAVEIAKVSLEAATFQLENSLPVDTARAAVKEAESVLTRLKASLEIAEHLALNDVPIRIAETERDAAQVELDRAKKARQRYQGSVSSSEIIRHEAVAKKALLNVTKAEIERHAARLQPKVHRAEIHEQTETVQRQELLLQQEQKNLQLQRLTVNARETDLRRATLLLQRRQLRSPLSGTVSDVYEKSGQWVEQGTPVLRIVNLHRLRVEGYVNVETARHIAIGDAVHITFHRGLPEQPPTPGTVTHVGRDVDVVNQQIRIWAEFDNPTESVLPGMVGEMLVIPNRRHSVAGRRVHGRQ